MGHGTSDAEHVTDTARARITADVALRGVQPVARDLRVSRGALQSWLCGRARNGTALMIEVQASMLYGLAGEEPSL